MGIANTLVPVIDTRMDNMQLVGNQGQDAYRKQMDNTWMGIRQSLRPGDIDVVGVLKQLNQRHDKLVSEARKTNRQKMMIERNSYLREVTEFREKAEKEIKDLETKLQDMRVKEMVHIKESDMNVEKAVEDIIEVGEDQVN